MHRMPVLLLASTLFLASPALAAEGSAQPAPVMSSEHRLSEAEIEKVLETAARKRESAKPSGESVMSEEEGLPPAIHGEVGFAIGTGGYRSAFGTAVVPLPGDGVAILSLGTDRFGPGRDFYFYER